jgi:hypothetical protein
MAVAVAVAVVGVMVILVIIQAMIVVMALEEAGMKIEPASSVTCESNAESHPPTKVDIYIHLYSCCIAL